MILDSEDDRTILKEALKRLPILGEHAEKIVGLFTALDAALITSPLTEEAPDTTSSKKTPKTPSHQVRSE